jgi:Trp operon repressor
MTSRSTSRKRFTLVFVENLRQSLFKQFTPSRRSLRKRPASIEALMSIEKSDQEIQSDLQAAFTNVAHVTRQR